MRSAASRRGLVLLALVVALSGCSSATKKHYLKHLSTTIAPVGAEVDPMATTGTGGPVAAVNRNEDSPR